MNVLKQQIKSQQNSIDENEFDLCSDEIVNVSKPYDVLEFNTTSNRSKEKYLP